MSSLLESAKNNSKPVEQKVDTVSVMVSTISPKIKKILPKHIDSTRFIASVINTIKSNKKLLLCDQSSLLGAFMVSAQLGLEVGILGQCYVIPYYNKDQKITCAEFQFGYKGLITLAERTGKLKDLYAHTVHENDFFEYELGLERRLVHKPSMSDRGEIIGAYAVIRTSNDGLFFKYFSRDEVLKRKHVSKSSGSESSPWKLWEEEMFNKTALKYVLNRAGLSVELMEAIMNDEVIKNYSDDRDNYNEIDKDDVINVNFEVKE
jgi:recombination protein RecT